MMNLLLILCTLLVQQVVGDDSASIGSLVVTPMDYDTYGSKIDLQLTRYYTSGEVCFFDKTVTTINNQTKTIRNATIDSNGIFEIGTAAEEYYLNIDDVSGIVSVSDTDADVQGEFSVLDGNLYYNYNHMFVACEQSSGNYSLVWRGASSAAVCSGDWLLVTLGVYGSSNGELTSFLPDDWNSAVAETVVENTATTSIPVGSTLSYASSTAANGGVKQNLKSINIGIISLLSLINLI